MLYIYPYRSVITYQLFYIFVKYSIVVISIYKKVIGKYFSINGMLCNVIDGSNINNNMK